MELYKEKSNPDQVLALMKDSETVLEGAFVYLGTDGQANECDAVANPVYGLCTGFRDGKGVPLGSSYETITGTLTEARTGNTYAAAADNTTVDLVKAQLRPCGFGDVYTAELDADLGTTTGSGTPGYFISVLTTGAGQLDENTASTSQQQFRLVDNGKGENSAQNPIRRGNWVLFEVTEIQDYVTQG
jgi:hypothetical protein